MDILPAHGHGEPPSNSLTTSFSSGSLDIQLIVRGDPLPSLLSESASLDSFFSDATDPPPQFPSSKSPAFSLVGLGDGLELFSAETIRMADCVDKSAVIVSIPTLPRLKRMFKECLSIHKWAESSTDYKAPGHIPWRIAQSHTTSDWIPEGSILSPEKFSLALLKSRKCRDGLQSSPCVGPPPVCDSSCFEPLALDVSPKPNPTPDYGFEKAHITINLDPTPCKLSLPSLVVSDSHYTFPIPFESSSTIVGDATSTLARRRGKRVPPCLLLNKQTKAVMDLPYPGIPTAFLGVSPKENREKPRLDLDDKPTLRFEEMINNLRMQCSTLGPQTPPLDTSWNCRTPITTPAHSAEIPISSTRDKSECSSITVPVSKSGGAQEIAAVAARPPSGNHLPRSRQSSLDIRRRREARIAPPAKAAVQSNVIPRPPTRPAARLSRLQDITSTIQAPAVLDAKYLRSAMIKATTNSGRNTMKKVRFEVADNTPQLDDPLKHVAPAQSAPVRSSASAAPREHSQDPNSAVQKPVLQRSTSWTQKPPWKDLRRTRSALSSEPRSHSLIVKQTPSSTATTVAVKNVGLRDNNVVEAHERSDATRPASSLGRHSLSRIIKGPIFSSRDSRRATNEICGHGVDENAVRRASQSIPSVNCDGKRKSRMPIPLRNILTRFK